jgi:F-type H+-transporting ATPase subunit delta
MSVATAYGKALFEAAQEGGVSADQLIQIESELDRFSETLAESSDLRVALYGPLATAHEKTSIIEKFSEKLSISPLTIRFITLVAAKGRLHALADIRKAFSTIRIQSEGGVGGELVTAEGIDAADVESLAASFGKKLGKKVAFRVLVDPDLLAGMKVTVGGVTYDGSLRSQLERLRDQFVSGFRS